jgi:hypothetical protein
MSTSQFYLKLTPRRSQGGGIVLGLMCDLDRTNHPSLKYVNGDQRYPIFGLAKPLPGTVYWILKQITLGRRKSLYFGAEYILYEPAQTCTVHHIR